MFVFGDSESVKKLCSCIIAHGSCGCLILDIELLRILHFRVGFPLVD